MARQQALQHKAQREERKSKELCDFRRENLQLRRKVARLQKEVEKMKANQPEPELEPEALLDISPRCNSCNSSNIRTLLLPSGTIVTYCHTCGNRGKL